MPEQTFFGTLEQIRVARRAAALWDIVQDDVRFSTHGRAVGSNGLVSTDINLQTALAGLQGVGVQDYLPIAEQKEREAALQSRGYGIDSYRNWLSTENALSACEAYLQSHTLPADIDLVRVDSDTPLSLLSDLSDLLAACDMMLPMESFVRGIPRPSVYLIAVDKAGRPVAHASATAAFHSDAPNYAETHWGMLATLPERRGEGLAAYLGALAMVEINRDYGFTTFSTGIRPGNVPSEKLCSMLGLARSDYCIVLAFDPEAFDGASITK